MRYSERVGAAIDSVLLAAREDESYNNTLLLGVDTLDTSFDIEAENGLNDIDGIQSVNVTSELVNNGLQIKKIDIYGKPKILNNIDYDKVVTSQGKFEATVHIIDGDFLSTIDGIELFNKNVVFDARDIPLDTVTLVREDLALKNYTLDELEFKLDNLIESGVQLQIISELNVELDDIEEAKMILFNSKIHDIAHGNVAYNITFDRDYTKDEFTERVHGITKDTSSIMHNSETLRERVIFSGNILSRKPYFSIQHALVSAGAMKLVNTLNKSFNVYLCDNSGRKIPVTARRF